VALVPGGPILASPPPPHMQIKKKLFSTFSSLWLSVNVRLLQETGAYSGFDAIKATYKIFGIISIIIITMIINSFTIASMKTLNGLGFDLMTIYD
jgi:hypothetical protein